MDDVTSAYALLDSMAADPGGSALLLDYDGTLAPIVSRPDDARLLPGARAVIQELRDRLGLVAFISGRGLADLRARVDIPGLGYSGNHGMEMQDAHGSPALAAGVAAWRGALDAFIADHDGDPERVAGVEVEDKGATLSIHWRNAVDHAAAEAWLRGERTRRAGVAGLDTTWGRMVMEVRPPVRIDKGTAARAFVTESGAAVAVHIGDDRTDADAWRELHAMRDGGALRVGAGIAAVAADAPADLVAAADARVPGPDGALAALEYLRGLL